MEIDRSYALIHLDNLLNNYNILKKTVGERQIMAVVKADAYGHGSVPISRFLEANGCRYFAVASLEEAIELREGGVRGEILIFGRTTEENFKYLDRYDLIQTVHSEEYANLLSASKLEFRVHLNIDTGMSRFGFYLHSEADLDPVVESTIRINSMPNLRLEGIYTHFADSDEPNSDFCQVQFSLFKLLLDELTKHHLGPLLRHAANSAATIAYPDTHLDLVRVGIAMYGYPPRNTLEDFKPVMEVFSRISSIRYVTNKDSVSYGRTYHPENKEKIATVAIGYADGYNRLLSNADYLVFRGTKLPVVGRVCMDAIMVKVDNVEIKEGDFVQIFGMDKPMRSMCATLKTIPYEILCAVSKRVNRIYEK